jgi:hypothetical protein
VDAAKGEIHDLDQKYGEGGKRKAAGEENKFPPATKRFLKLNTTSERR